MKCPECSHQLSKVVDVRAQREHTRKWRRRECLACGFRYNTLECMAGKSSNLVPYNTAWNEAVNAAIANLRELKKARG